MLSNGIVMLIICSCNIFYVHFATQTLKQNFFDIYLR